MKHIRQQGFSLVELLIVVVIVAILSSLAYSGYTIQIQNSRRADAQGEMMALAASLEAWRAQNFAYTGATIAALSPKLATSNFYNVTLTLQNNDQAYLLEATPLGQQAGAGHLALNSQGQSCFLKASDTACDLNDPLQAWGKK